MSPYWRHNAAVAVAQFVVAVMFGAAGICLLIAAGISLTAAGSLTLPLAFVAVLGSLISLVLGVVFVCVALAMLLNMLRSGIGVLD